MGWNNNVPRPERGTAWTRRWACCGGSLVSNSSGKSSSYCSRVSWATFQAQSWHSWQCNCNGRPRLTITKEQQFQSPSMAVASIVLLQLFLLINQMFNFSILAKIQYRELHFLSLPRLNSTASARAAFPSPCSSCNCSRAGAGHHPRTSCRWETTPQPAWPKLMWALLCKHKAQSSLLSTWNHFMEFIIIIWSSNWNPLATYKH